VALLHCRLELTGFIKEVRHNKHGSLTGLSLEDIVTSVSELVEQKKKVWQAENRLRVKRGSQRSNAGRGCSSRHNFTKENIDKCRKFHFTSSICSE